MIKFDDKMVKYNHNFRLFITTKLPNPHYAPEIASNTTLCNFAIKEQGKYHSKSIKLHFQVSREIDP